MAIDSTKRPEPRGGWRIGLRTLLLLAILPLALLPWSGLRFVERMAELARDAQWETQRTAARSLAASLHERPDLFPAGAGAGRVPRGMARAAVDPLAARWRDATRQPVPVQIEGSAPGGTLKLDYALVAGTNPTRIWLLLEADDERFVPPGDIDTASGGPVVRAGDAATVLVGGEPALLAALAAEDARRSDPIAPDAITLPTRIPVALTPTSTGWRAEVELPEDTRLIRITATDVDYLGSRAVEARADSGVLLMAVASSDPVADAVVRNRERQWDEVLRAMDRGLGRVSIYDARGVLLARRGEMVAAAPAGSPPPSEEGLALHRRLARGLLAIAVRLGGIDDDASGTSPVTTALSGVPSHRAERLATSTGMPAWQLSAAHPVWVADRVVGALLLEDSTVERLALAQDALERLALFVAAAIAATVLALLAVASLAVSRILRLRRAAEAAIDSRGRVVGTVVRDGLRDEVDALAESYGRVLERLREHQAYLARLRSRLLHELRTPIMVVRSSLDNLALETDPARSAAYAERAQAGAARLERIVASMGEAGSLEAMLGAADLERVDLGRLVAGCVDGYRTAYPRAQLQVLVPPAPAVAAVVPEAIAQALDKLVANAVDFARPGTPIIVSLAEARVGRIGGWRVAVRNQGPPLPAAMAGSLFESMVSVRDGEAAAAEGVAVVVAEGSAGATGAGSVTEGGGRGHLGFGLYLVRLIAEFHGGSASAADVPGGVEVGFTIADAITVPDRKRRD